MGLMQGRGVETACGRSMLCRGIVSCARDGVAESLIGLVDQLCAGFRFLVQRR